MANLAPIVNSAETINADFQSSINAAFTELHNLFGFWPVVLAPNGGARTQAQCDALGTPWAVSDHYEDAQGRAAVDIDNQSTFRARNEALFLNTLAKYGWSNIQVNGQPFPREPWHFAKHGISTAGESGTPINNTPRSNTMYDLIPGANDASFAMVCTSGLDIKGNVIEIALSATDWGMMVRAKYNSGPLSADENNQYRALVKSMLAQIASGVGATGGFTASDREFLTSVPVTVNAHTDTAVKTVVASVPPLNISLTGTAKP